MDNYEVNEIDIDIDDIDKKVSSKKSSNKKKKKSKDNKSKDVKKKVKKVAFILVHLIALASVIYFSIGLYNSSSIGKFLEEYMPTKYVISIILVILLIALLLLMNILNASKRTILASIVAFSIVIGSGSMAYAASYMVSIEKALQNASGGTTSEINIVFMTSSDLEVTELNDVSVGLLSNINSNEGYIAPSEYLATKSGIEEKYEYNSWHDLILALANGDVEVIVLPAAYESILEEDTAYLEHKDKLVQIDSYKMTIKNEEKTIEDVNKPFNILLAGTDSPLTGSTSGYLFDVVIIATIDPSTGSVVLTSVPRDSLLYSSCIGGYDKITHNGGYGIECLEETLETSFNTTIDYYMIIGFEGIIDIVEYLNGVTITNPYGDIKVQNSKRQLNTISIPGGTNLLNGEQTLAFARNRKATTTGVEIDANIRSSNHIIVLKAILERMKEVGITNDIDGLINIVADSTITNFPINDLVSISKIASSLLGNELNIKSITLEGVGVTYNSPAAGGQPLYGYLPYSQSVDYITDYINMVYNQTYIPIDPSTNLSTGAPKVKPSGGTNYTTGGGGGGSSNNTDDTTEEPKPTKPVEPEPVEPVEPDPVEPDPVDPVDPVDPGTGGGTGGTGGTN